MTKTIIDGVHKTEIQEVQPGLYLVSYFELMGGRYVPIGNPELWSACALMELLGEI